MGIGAGLGEHLALMERSDMKIKDLTIFVDSQLVANQVKGVFEARQPIIKQYLEKTKEVLRSFDNYTMEYVRRDQNKKADALSKLASMTFSRLANEVRYKLKASFKRYTKAHAACMQGHEVQGLLNSFISNKNAKAKPDINNFGVAFFSIGNRHRRAFTNGFGRRKVPSCSHRLLYQMGRSEASSIHNSKTYGEVRMGAHRMQIQSSPNHHL
ncbi:reverse transcriptase domain-containing protein [Tanacetum coccineum]